MHKHGSHNDIYQIVEPGQSDKADVDLDVYHQAMRGGRSEIAAVVLFAVVFIVTALLGGAALRALGGTWAVGALVAGISSVVCLAMIKRSNKRIAKHKAIRLQAELHALEQQATALEIEAARASGAFDQWKKP